MLASIVNGVFNIFSDKDRTISDFTRNGSSIFTNGFSNLCKVTFIIKHGLDNISVTADKVFVLIHKKPP